VNVSDEDLSLIQRSLSTIAHCPRSNAKFGHGYAPFEKMLDAKIGVGLGSDSVASNNNCDMFGEARFAAYAARNLPGTRRMISAADVLEAATLGGARAMGLADVTGTLEPGKQADMAVVSLDSIAQSPVTDVIAALVFSSGAADVVRTIVAGRDVYNGSGLVNCDTRDIIERLRSIGGQ
jgi:5-methylthioadenosine/S-adenosylhomocysteine deaminase